MSQAIKPEAVDAYLPIGSIIVVERHRTDLGDIGALAESIEDVGLLNPITVTRTGRLIAGQRRLEAVREIGWDLVPVRYADSVQDATALLRAERDENTCRKDMTPEELVGLGLAIEELLRPAAMERQRDGQELGRAVRNGELVSSSSQGNQDRLANETATAVGDALGLGRSRYYMAKTILAHAVDPSVHPDLRETAQSARVEMNESGKVTPAYEKLKSALRRDRARRETEEATTAAIREVSAEWIPENADRSVGARERREQVIREMAAAGYSSRQMSSRLGIADEYIRGVARNLGVDIPADAVMVKTRRHDSSRIVRETAIALEGLAMGVQLVNVSELDPAEVNGWASSITTSIRALNRLVKQMKEQTS